MLLSNLIKTIKITKLYNFKEDCSFSSITANSKLTNKKTVFIFDKNSKSKIKYINEAIKNKTPAIISNKYYKFIKVPQFIVDNINFEIELVLKNIYKKGPYRSIAVTGTNGKTSVVWYISKILNLLNYNNTAAGTIGYFKNGKKIEKTNLTTPAYEELFKYGCAKNNKKNIYIFEASSHALDQNRLRNYPVNVAAITNISQDHLDYHKKFSNYKKSKLKLFTQYLSDNGYAIINSRIKNFNILKKKILNKNIKIKYFGNKKNVFLEKRNDLVCLFINNKKYKIKKLNLKTDFELENLECAISCCLSLNISKKKLIDILPKVTNPPGRLQIINYKKKKSKIFIDYAHTPEALRRTLQSLTFDNKKPIVLFGCGGERDKSKRKLMGSIANNYASKVYITDDNPRYENPSIIRQSILRFCPNGIEVPDRKKAIERAVTELKTKDILIIAGKGHENIQILKNKKLKFNDYLIVKNLI